MVAVVILSLSLTVVSRSFIQTLSALRTSAYFFKGGLLLEKKILEFEEAPPSGKDGGTFEEFGKLFHWSVETEEMENAPLYEALVKVGWTIGGREQTLAVKTYLAEPDASKEK